MKWFKMYGEARNDAKLRSLSDEHFRIWFNLLCLASEQEDRGVISGYDELLLAIEVCNADVTLLNVTLEKLVTLRILTIDENYTVTFLKFTDRQHEKPSDAPQSVRERVRRSREKKRFERESENVTPDVTPCNALHDECNAIDKNRLDKNRLEQSTYGARPETTFDPVDIESPLAMEVRKICKVPLMCPSNLRLPLENTLRGLTAEGATLDQVAEFGRKVHQHWCGLDKNTQKPRAPTVGNVHRCWREVLALTEPTETPPEKKFTADQLAELRARGRNGTQPRTFTR
jgi:hypothetical protein